MEPTNKKKPTDYLSILNSRNKPRTQLAIIGRTTLMPGILPVKVFSPKGECLVTHSFHEKIVDPKRGFELDISDCTAFTVTHIDKEFKDISRMISEQNPEVAQSVDELLEQALQAVSEFIIWSKAADQVGKVSSFHRQVGWLDVKFFFLEMPDEKLIAWKNPLFTFDLTTSVAMSGALSEIFGNMVVTNGPSANPIPPITRRIMSSLDLINLGFYTESFVNVFSLADDLVQEVIKKGLEKKGLNMAEQKSMLRSIKEERLKHYLTNLAKLCDWKSLEVEDKAFFDTLMKINTIRNNIMHGSTRISRNETINAVRELLNLINWLKINPFGYFIPDFPLLNLALAEFFILEPKPK